MKETDPKKVNELLDKYKDKPLVSWKGAKPQPKKEDNDKNKLY